LTEEKSRVLKWIKNKTLEQFKTIYLLLISKARCEILLPKVYALKNLILLPVYALIQPRKLLVLWFFISVFPELWHHAPGVTVILVGTKL